MVLNPNGQHYTVLKSTLQSSYEDFYFDEDAIFMERNSRDFRKRVPVINQNAEAVCDHLRSVQLSPNPADRGLIKNVWYPKFITREHYDACRARDLLPGASAFGGLFSVTFEKPEASRAFFDALKCQKGPSLGTNFTLASPYVVLAHYTELEWAKEFGVDEGLVRVSVGIEDRDALLKITELALDAAREANGSGSA